MAYRDITEGEKIAKPLGARFIESPKKRTLGVEVEFSFKEESTDTIERLRWVGWLSEKTIERTMETLHNVLGYNGSEQADDRGVLTDPKALNYNQEVKLVVEFETNTENGKTYPKIKWVNRLGGSAFEGVAPSTIKSKLASVNFRAQFLAVKKTSIPASADSAPAFIDDEEIPF